REDHVGRIPFSKNRLAVVFDRPASPGNLGSITRSCDALGAGGLITTGHSADIYDPETISASRGSLFALPVVRLEGPAEVGGWLLEVQTRHPGLHIVATDERAETHLWEHDFTAPTVLLLGNETWGLSAGMRELANSNIAIPMMGSA